MGKKNDFTKVFKVIKEDAKKSTRFSKASFDELALSMLNSDYKTDVVKSRTEEGVTTIPVEVTKKFANGFIKPILKDFGVDSHEAEEINNYEFTKVDGLYELSSELITAYMETGKSFNFLPKEDCVGSLSIQEQAPTVKTSRILNKKDEKGNDLFTTVQIGKFSKVKAKSVAPKNKKKKIK